MLLDKCFRVLIVLFLANQYHTQLVHAFDSKPFMYGKKLKGFTFRSFNNTSAKQCLEECNRRPRCASLNYFRMSHICELNCHQFVVKTSDLTDATGYAFSNALTVKADIYFLSKQMVKGVVNISVF